MPSDFEKDCESGKDRKTGNWNANAVSLDLDKLLFENLPELLTPDMVAAELHSTRGTVYQWHYRPSKYLVPSGMFIKHGRKLLIRRDRLRAWVLSRSSYKATGGNP